MTTEAWPEVLDGPFVTFDCQQNIAQLLLDAEEVMNPKHL